MPTEKRCITCGVEKGEDKFYLRPDSGKRRSECTDCRSASNLHRYHTNTSTNTATRRASRKHYLRKLYGMTEADYAKRIEEQGRACAICGKQEETLCVDHCHDTGAVRGLLCRSCNSGIGHLQDDLRIVEAAASYLKRSAVGFVCS